MTLSHFLFWIKYKRPDAKPSKVSANRWKAMVRHYQTHAAEYAAEEGIRK